MVGNTSLNIVFPVSLTAIAGYTFYDYKKGNRDTPANIAGGCASLLIGSVLYLFPINHSAPELLTYDDINSYIQTLSDEELDVISQVLYNDNYLSNHEKTILSAKLETVKELEETSVDDNEEFDKTISDIKKVIIIETLNNKNKSQEQYFEMCEDMGFNKKLGLKKD